MKRRLRVTGLTFVRVGLGGELRSVRIGVAALAGIRRKLILRLGASRLMAASTCGALVLSLQLEGALLVILDGVESWLKTFLVVTRRAITASDPCRELPSMNVFMTVGAHFMRHVLAEIATGMALETGDIAVFAEQWKLRSSMVKPRVALQRLPPGRDVAVRATAGEGGVFKRALVWIGVTVVAAGIAQLTIMRQLLAGDGLVTA